MDFGTKEQKKGIEKRELKKKRKGNCWPVGSM
jgi:hypothetical protein